MALTGQPGAKPATKEEDAGSRKEAYEAYKVKRAAKQKERYEQALKLKDELVKHQLFDKLMQPTKEFVISLCQNPEEKKASGFGGPSVYTQLFGSNPKVGDKITLEEAFNKTFKGKSTLDMWVKRWAEKGIIVECVIDKQRMLNTTYTIKDLHGPVKTA